MEWTRADRELVGPPTERSEPASLSNQPATYLVLSGALALTSPANLFARRHAGMSVVEQDMSWFAEL